MLLLAFLLVTATGSGCVRETAAWSEFDYKPTWDQQLGTVTFPKQPENFKMARARDVFTCDGELHMAIEETPIQEVDQHSCDQFQDTMLWHKLIKGSFLLPKTLEDEISNVGSDVFYDDDSDNYYVAVCDQARADELGGVMYCLQQVDEYSNWMTLLSDVINNTRLGDLAIAGSHDTGTAEINEDSYLVDQFFLFQLGDLVAPDIVVNWSLTQGADVAGQLEAGFRQFDMRIADLESVNDTFRWWHGLSSQEIFDDLQAFRDFAEAHPNEIVMIDFNKFVSPGDSLTPTFPITEERRDELHDVIMGYLEPVLVPAQGVAPNPTVGEVLATGRNTIAFMEDDYMQGKTDFYWPRAYLVGRWTGQTNPEELFLDRTSALLELKQNHPDDITEISGCITPGARTVVAGAAIVYGDHPLVQDILDRLFPGYNASDVFPDQMSFEGLFVDLLTVARDGMNTEGMRARPEDLYTSGYSVQYRGGNDMFHFWLARNNIYKNNILYSDDSAVSSDLPRTAVAYNSGNLKREVAITFNGNTLTGFYYWANLTAQGGDLANYCSDISVVFGVSSATYNLSKKNREVYELVMVEGEFPPDALVSVYVTSPGAELVLLYLENIQYMIDNNLDLYVRGSDLGDGSGFAYISKDHNLFGTSCEEPPEDGYENITSW